MLKKVLFSSVLILTFIACSDQKQEQTQKEAPALPVEIVIIKERNIPIWMPYTGKTQASSSQEVRARVQGILEEIYYKDGDFVKKGQKLFKIEQADYIANLNTAKAKKRRNLATLRLAQADVNRYKPLVKDGLAPRVTLEQYEAQVATVEADISSDNASIKQAELELSYTVIKAPIDGQASRRLVDIGNLVGKNEATILTTINNNNPMYAYFSPSEEDFQKIKKFKDREVMEAYITFNYESELLKDMSKLGFVDFSDNTVDPGTSTISMRAEIPNEDNSVFPGTFVHVNIFVTQRFSLIGIPPEVIFEDQRGKFVYVVSEQNTAHKKYIKPVYDSRFFTLLKKGSLDDGDKVVITGLLRLRENQPLKATDMTATKGIDAVIKDNKLIPELPEKKN
ncbi:MAG: efflux transporter periplasmic adaptor subunit [Arcobacter sp.]|nr:MAG: efflux transporter periplasmic adaptor subunit [Arcobacter sp.]